MPMQKTRLTGSYTYTDHAVWWSRT